MFQSDGIFFVFLGKYLPNYAKYSLKLARMYSGAKVNFIGDAKIQRQISDDSVNFFALEDFYDGSAAKEVISQITFSPEFRNGFWLKTLERFFVLEQYMQLSNKRDLFHAELDQLLFRTDLLIKNLKLKESPGLYFPFHTESKAIASVFYCNSRHALSSLIDFSLTGPKFSNEMELLANWAQKNRDLAFRLPTLTDFILETFQNEQRNHNLVEIDSIEGLVDAAQLGQWIAGIDPTLIPINQIPQNHFIENYKTGLLSKDNLYSTKLFFNTDEKIIKLKFKDQKEVNLFNLHVHSKIHEWIFKNDSELTKLISISNQQHDTDLRILRLIQIKEFLKSTLKRFFNNPTFLFNFLLKRFYEKFDLRPSSDPFLSGDTFRKYSDYCFEKNNFSMDITYLKQNSIIFCESDFFERFTQDVLEKINKKIILILGNSDRNFTNLDFDINIFNKCTAIFAQNLIEPCPGVLPLPIGLENRQLANNGLLNAFRLARLIRPIKTFRVMVSFSTDTNPVVRNSAIKSLLKFHCADFLGRLTSSKHRKALKHYAFVASPPGNGFDTHRTWEALYLRTVPIVQRSFMTEEFERLGLPIWVVDSFDDLIGLDEKFLKAKYLELKPRFDSEVLWFKYWANCIKSFL